MHHWLRIVYTFGSHACSSPGSVKVVNLKTQEPPQRLHKKHIHGSKCKHKEHTGSATYRIRWEVKHDDMVNIQVQASSCQISAY